MQEEAMQEQAMQEQAMQEQAMQEQITGIIFHVSLQKPDVGGSYFLFLQEQIKDIIIIYLISTTSKNQGQDSRLKAS